VPKKIKARAWRKEMKIGDGEKTKRKTNPGDKPKWKDKARS